MTDDDGAHKRRSRRSLVLLAAKVRTPDSVVDVRLRNLSQNGALLESRTPPAVGTAVVFERGETVVQARVVWAAQDRFGIEFLMPIEESEVLVHVGRPAKRPLVSPGVGIFKRPGFPSAAPQEQKSAAPLAKPAEGRRFD